MTKTPSIHEIVSLAKNMGNGEITEDVPLVDYEPTDIAAILAFTVESLMKEAVVHRTSMAKFKEQYNLNFDSLCSVIEDSGGSIVVNSKGLGRGTFGNRVINYDQNGDLMKLCLSSVGDVVDNAA